MTQKHTQGPWTVGHSMRQEKLFMDAVYGPERTHPTDPNYSGGSPLICHVMFDAVHRSTEEIEANAALIAAAPDLLWALRQLVLDVGCEGEEESLKHARAAIAKAEGR